MLCGAGPEEGSAAEGSHMKRKRTGSGGSGGGAGGNMNAVGGDRGDVRLSGEMQALMKGRKYVKESELTRQVLLEYAKQKGAVKLVELVRVQVEQFGGSSFVAVLDDTESKVRDLKRAIEDKQGVLRRFQALFLLDDNGKATSDVPLARDVLLSDESSVVLCVVTEGCWEWDASSSLLRAQEEQQCCECCSDCRKREQMVALSGYDNSIATLLTDDEEGEVVMTTSEVLGSGTHRISFKIIMGDLVYLGVVRDGAVYNQTVQEWLDIESTVGWFMSMNSGCLYGNGKHTRPSERPGGIRNGQTLTLELDMGAGTLKFWRDGEPHGTGWNHGVQGRLRWAFIPVIEGNAVQIVDTKK